jgi:transposase InsO family protein
MKHLGLEGARRGKAVKTTFSEAGTPCPQDRVNRQFKAERPNQLWVSDFTYVSTWQGFVYVTFLIDVFARRIVGWRKKGELDINLVQKLYAMEDRFQDENWKRGIELLKESYSFSHSKDYIGFEVKNDKGEWLPINLQFSNI